MTGAAGAGAGAGAGVAAAATSFASILGDAANVWVSIYALREQRKENRKARQMNEALFERGAELEATAQREERQFSREETAKAMRYKAQMSFLDNLLASLNTQPQAAANLSKLLRGRR
jgi:hypothetical protein